MAYHDDKPGHTPIILGRYYYRFRSPSFGHKLIRVNEVTGICGVRMGNGIYWVSATQLSNWYILPEAYIRNDE